MKIKKTFYLAVILVLLIGFATGLTASADSLADIASPVSNPVNFEDPRIESNIKPLYVHHRIDNQFATGGGEVDIYALQVRYAVSDKLALIATKDGYVNFRPNGLLEDGSGFANIGLGAKYAFWQSDRSIVTAGLRYEAPTGESEALQGKGDGIVNPFISAGTSLGVVNLIAYSGFRAAIDNSDSSFFDASLHMDTKIGRVSPLLELNMFHVVSAGDRLGIEDEGQDFFNLGSALSDGETMLTAAVGARIGISESISFGTAYEFPLITDSGSYITDWRLTSDLVYSF